MECDPCAPASSPTSRPRARSRRIRKGIDLGVAANSLTGMLFGGMLRITAGCSEGYTPDQYVATCVDIFAAGLAPCPWRLNPPWIMKTPTALTTLLLLAACSPKPPEAAT